MKLNSVTAALSAALLVGSAHADEAQKVLKDDSADAAAPAPKLATFTVS
jgi:hypothetical protein